MILNYLVRYNDSNELHELIVCFNRNCTFSLVDVRNRLILPGKFTNTTDLEKYLNSIGKIEGISSVD